MLVKQKLSLAVFVAAFSFFVVAACLFANRWFSRGFSGNAAIDCWNPVVNLGRLSGDGPYACDFIVLNVGSDELTIEDIKPGCGDCIKIVDFPKRPIPPNQRGKIRTLLMTQTLRGAVRRSISVRSNDPAHPWLILRIEAEVGTDSPAVSGP